VNLDTQGQYAQAEPLLRQALALRRTLLGEEHPQTAHSLDSLAVNLHYQGKYSQAELLYRKALALRQKLLSEGHPDTASRSLSEN
jgi:tetratricopeptide (TPR) repeat protein